MSNLANSCLAVSDGKAYVACNAYNLFTIRSGDGLPVEAKIHIIFTGPCIREGHIIFKIVVTFSLDLGKTCYARPGQAAAMGFICAAARSANAVLMRCHLGKLKFLLSRYHYCLIFAVIADKDGGIGRTGNHAASICRIT